MPQNKAADISISDVRTVLVHAVCSVRTLLKQYPPISDGVYANSRTLDIGIVCGLILRHPLVLKPRAVCSYKGGLLSAGCGLVEGFYSL